MTTPSLDVPGGRQTLDANRIADVGGGKPPEVASAGEQWIEKNDAPLAGEYHSNAVNAPASPPELAAGQQPGGMEQPTETGGISVNRTGPGVSKGGI